MQNTWSFLKFLGSTPSAGFTLKQNALRGPNIQSTDPTLALFSRQTPRLNLGKRAISVHFTTKLFSDLWRKVPQGMTNEGGPLSKPPRLLKLPPKPPRPLGAPLGAPLNPPLPPRWKLPPLGASLNSLPILIIYQHCNIISQSLLSFFESTRKQYNDTGEMVIQFSFIIQYMQETGKQKVEQKKQEKKEEKHQVKPEGKVEQHEGEAENDEKDPQTLSQGERRGLSKQQLRKLQKKLARKQKEKAKEQAQKAALNKQKKDKKGNNKQPEVKIDQAYLKQFNSQKIVLEPNTKLPEEGAQNILITSALPYVNNIPHLGNIIGCVLSADVYSRFKKLQGANVLYICGTDEYGTATEVKAIEQKKTPKQVCDFYYKIHAEVYKWFDIGFDYFGRTSTEWHTKITQQIFLNIQKEGRILKENMSQCYCQNCNLFLADRYICGICPHSTCKHPDARGDQCDKCGKLFNSPTELVDYRCNICKKPPVIRDTTHFFINLPTIQEELKEWVEEASKKGEWSTNSITITKGWINLGLKPKCITRDLKWGVPVPIEQYKQKVFYVWFDAPIGYPSITANLLQQDYKAWWQNNKQVKLYQFMGKDNVPFHTVIFPSSLIASRQGWTLLHHISTTEYLNYQGGKFSKTHGTGVFGNNVIQLEKDISSEVWRYYLLVNRPQNSDSQFSWKDFADKNNNELLAKLGNLVNRVLKFLYKTEDKKIPVLDENLLTDLDFDFLTQMENRYQKYVELLNKVEIKEGLKFSMEISSRGNKYLQDSRFWQQENIKSGRTLVVLNIIANFLRFEAFLIEPYMPSTSAKICFLLGLERTQHDATLGRFFNQKENVFLRVFLGLTAKSTGIRQPIPLFNTISEEQTALWRERFGGKQEVKNDKAV